MTAPKVHRCDELVEAVAYRLVDHGGHHAALVVVVIAALRIAFAVVGPTPPVPIAHVGTRRPLRLGAAAFLRRLHGRQSVRFLLLGCTVVAGVGCARVAVIAMGIPDETFVLVTGSHAVACGVLLASARPTTARASR